MSSVTPGWQPLLDRMTAEPDPRRRANLEVVARHVVEEVAGNLPALMATLVPEPEYTVWGASDSTGPSGHDQVVQWYRRLQAAGRNRLDYRIVRVVADENCVVTEGDFQYAIAGRDLDATRTEAGEDVRPDDYHLVSHRATVLWPISPDGLIEGEHIYSGERHRVLRRLAPGELPHLGPAHRAQSDLNPQEEGT
ncbi:nuclear transport factor 2 family protein [Nocardia farcinica]|uniref:nuclear transport factor 2 family protein n=1 Tax=Nocardia farcinica TaxID=37329 RepID=UPI000A3B0F22|nr:nuclear transport factor 2 family protein [Nocardia farcinica]MBA4857491.1 nuclear transport factor 2 family protein [Nocardia farcinica]MBC9816210.1 nuclear transport factor 2 family protein [Nocardia farcinica]MBF6072441.1 nuclear transport factor 2 family protein [Nocardia farcinica]MBF6262387.1 nuclear transport factor 2 family protein [Nocardia farcinica]MBF6280927.1 nuclear transport factor 2 family protein [Nocardia farcinica]